MSRATPIFSGRERVPIGVDRRTGRGRQQGTDSAGYAIAVIWERHAASRQGGMATIRCRTSRNDMPDARPETRMRYRWNLSRVLLAGLFAMAPVGAGVAASGAAERKAEAQVLEVEEIRLRAMLDADIETLDRITAADYVHVESSGQVRTKAQFLDGLRDREYRFKRFVIEENDVRIMGSAAVVTGRYHNVIETPDGVQPVKYARHIRVYERRNGQWMNVAHQATAISPDLR